MKAFRAPLYVIYLLTLVVLFAGTAEVILRLSGLKPWRTPDVPVQVDPGGKFFIAHPTLGYSHIPGKFIVTLGSGYSFHVTHLPNTQRVTRAGENGKAPIHEGEIWIFGCSFTHGWSVNDDETYPWLLQERFPEYRLVNFGVSGYGTIHSLLQFRDALKTTTPGVAVLAYADFHDLRNTFSRARRKAVSPYNKLGPLVQPYARVDDDGRLQYSIADVDYSEFPMMRHSALAHFIETKYNQFEPIWHRSRAVSEALVEEMARLAEKHGVKFVVANISGGHEMLDFAEKNGIASIDISVDLGLPENTNRPHDSHPSAIAHQKYADGLERFLRAELLE